MEGDKLKTSERIAREMYAIVMDEEAKTSDRISAAKLLFEMEKKSPVDNTIVVKFEAIDDDFLV